MWYTTFRLTGHGLISPGYTKPGPMMVIYAATEGGDYVEKQLESSTSKSELFLLQLKMKNPKYR